MAYDESLADRVRAALQCQNGVTEKKMFGGVCFMVDGHMCCGVASNDLVLRLGEDGAAVALEEAHTRPFDITGKPMKTMLFVSPKGHRGDEALRGWVDRALSFARGLPPQQPKRQGEKHG